MVKVRFLLYEKYMIVRPQTWTSRDSGYIFENYHEEYKRLDRARKTYTLIHIIDSYLGGRPSMDDKFFVNRDGIYTVNALEKYKTLRVYDIKPFEIIAFPNEPNQDSISYIVKLELTFGINLENMHADMLKSVMDNWGEDGSKCDIQYIHTLYDEYGCGHLWRGNFQPVSKTWEELVY